MKCNDTKPNSVAAYIASAPEYAKPICKALRQLVAGAVPRLREVIKWGAPCYEGRKLVCGFGAFKHHVTFFCFRSVELKEAARVFGPGIHSAAMHGLKITTVGQIPAAALKKLLRAAAELDADINAEPKPRARRPELPMPADLASAIKTSTKAAAFFETLPPSAKRDFIEWVTEAKRPETRTRRLAESVKMLAGGHRRNEQYRP